MISVIIPTLNEEASRPALLDAIRQQETDQLIFSASLVYSISLVARLGCSAAYNLASNAARRGFPRQLDHTAIFLMIAGTYTSFTTCRLHGVWTIGMTAAVWTGAVTGAVMKLICPIRIDRVSIIAYLALGWIILVGGATQAKLGRCSDGGFDRSWRGILFRRDRPSPLADAAFPQRNMAQLRVGRGQLSLRSCFAWCGVGRIVSLCGQCPWMTYGSG